jgi:hypothetical protein
VLPAVAGAVRAVATVRTAPSASSTEIEMMPGRAEGGTLVHAPGIPARSALPNSADRSPIVSCCDACRNTAALCFQTSSALVRIATATAESERTKAAAPPPAGSTSDQYQHPALFGFASTCEWS